MRTKVAIRGLALMICAVLMVSTMSTVVLASEPTEPINIENETTETPNEGGEVQTVPQTEEPVADVPTPQTEGPGEAPAAPQITDTSVSSGDAVTAAETQETKGSETTKSTPVEEEVPNTDIKVIPSDANALILMDVGAQSPKGVPGNVVTIILPVAVNKEYLPTEKYMLRNINVYPDIPTDTSVSNWPFDIIDASDVRHLDDMSYNSTAEIYYDFRISQFAKKGVYPVNFNVNATVWREDDVNGTSITEDVTFELCVYVTITEDGNMSGVTTGFCSLQVAGSNVDGTYTIPSGRPNQTVNMKIPVINVGGTLTKVTVSPVVSASLDEFPFMAEATNYSQYFEHWASNEIKYLDYTFKVSPLATSGNKAIKFKASYFENDASAEGNFSTQFTIIDGYDASAMSVMVQGYKIYVEGTEVSGLMAGEETELQLTVVNNSKTDTAKKVISSLVFTNAPGLTLCVGSTDTGYVDSIKPGGTAVLKYKIMARQDAEVGSAMLGINLTYETTEAVAGKAAQNILLPISQVMELVAGSPEIYGTPSKDKDTTISVPLTNMGRAKAMNIRIMATDGLTTPTPAYIGDLLAGGSTSADITVGFYKSGKFIGKLIVQYEDANGQVYSQEVAVPVNVEEEPIVTQEVVSTEVEESSNGFWGNAWWMWLILILLIVLLVILIVCLVRHFRKNRNERDDEDDFDIGTPRNGGGNV